MPTSFQPITITYKVAVYAPAERADTLPPFHLPYLYSVLARQDPGMARHSSHKPLWSQSAVLAADSVGHVEIAGASLTSGVSGEIND